jgi:hypothetical protein
VVRFVLRASENQEADGLSFKEINRGRDFQCGRYFSQHQALQRGVKGVWRLCGDGCVKSNRPDPFDPQRHWGATCARDPEMMIHAQRTHGGSQPSGERRSFRGSLVLVACQVPSPAFLDFRHDRWLEFMLIGLIVFAFAHVGFDLRLYARKITQLKVFVNRP